MKNFTTILLCLLLTGGSVLSAQPVQVSGVVSEKGEPLPGVSVVVQGTTRGVHTDAEGRYAISVDPDASLVFSFIGMRSQTIAVSGRTVINVIMEAEVSELEHIVVTALGITKGEKALGYAVQSMQSEELTKAANSDLSGALQGKMSGLSIRPSSGMPGASSQITIRGVRSFSGDNTPLYVVDGMPISSTSDVNTLNSVTGTDFSNRAIDIDPNDIESINVLKGQAASALYGIRASNGVILITTKSGKGLSKGKAEVTFATNVSFDVISRYPKMQTTYAQGTEGAYSALASGSWGPRISDLPNDPTYGGNHQGYPGMYFVPQRENAGLDPWAEPQSYDNIREYFNTGVTWNSSLSVAQALERGSYAFALGTSTQDGIIPTTGMDRYNAKLNGQISMNDNWTTGASANYVYTSINKMPTANDGIMATIYPAPPSYDLAGIPQNYAGVPYQINNYRGGSFPPAYWALDNTDFWENTSRVFGNAFVDYKTKFDTDNHSLNVRYQMGVDSYITNYQDMWGYGIKGSDSNGQIENYNWSNVTFNSLVTATYDWKISDDWAFNAMLGNELEQNNKRFLYAYGSNFQFPGWNHINNAIVKNNAEEEWAHRTVGFFGSLSLSYKSFVYLNATGRNDFVSSMPRDNRSFFYPSVSLGVVLTELEALKNNPVLSFAKVRGSFAEVGQAGSYLENYYYVPQYGSGFYMFTPLIYPINGVNGYVPYYVVFDPNLQPQNTRSYEVGADLNFWDNLLSLNYTYSRQNVKDQIFEVPLAGSTGSQSLLTNAGSMHTNTHEITLGVNPIRKENINWDLTLNWTKSGSSVDELAPGVTSIMLGGFVTPQVRANLGDTYPVIYGSGYRRNDQGQILVDDNGMPMAGEPQVIGKVAPDFILGLSTNLRLWKVTVSAVLDWKSGGQMYSGTNGLLDFYGVSKSTEGREGTFVFDGYKSNGQKNDIPISGPAAWEQFYSTINNIDESSIYDSGFIKLRELAVNYQVLKNERLELNVNAFARNILVWSELPNLDPESSQGNNNMTGAFERFSLPQTASYGLGVSLKF